MRLRSWPRLSIRSSICASAGGPRGPGVAGRRGSLTTTSRSTNDSVGRRRTVSLTDSSIVQRLVAQSVSDFPLVQPDRWHTGRCAAPRPPWMPTLASGPVTALDAGGVPPTPRCEYCRHRTCSPVFGRRDLPDSEASLRAGVDELIVRAVDAEPPNRARPRPSRGAPRRSRRLPARDREYLCRRWMPERANLSALLGETTA